MTSEIENSVNQTKGIESKTKAAEKELKGLRKKYEKVKDKAYIRQLEDFD